MKHQKSTRSFASRWGFILASVGSAVGMANVWGFPNKLGSNGGGGIPADLPAICLYLQLCRPSGGIRHGAAGGHRHPGGLPQCLGHPWRNSREGGRVLGWLPLAGSLCIAIGYAVIVTYVLKALVDSLTGTLMTADAAAWFSSFFGAALFGGALSHHRSGGYPAYAVLWGAQHREDQQDHDAAVFPHLPGAGGAGIFSLPGAAEGYRFMFTPRWKALTDPMIWIWAMGQAFFSLSVTGSGMIVYGAYLSPQEEWWEWRSIPPLFDTIAAVVAALVIIPACFSYGLDVGAGPSLLFVTLPTILQDIPLGQLFAVILYIAMIFAGVSSLQNMFEAVAESLQNRFPRLSRTATLIILAVLCLGFGIGMETISQWGPWMDLVSIYIIPIGATLGAVSWFYVMKKDELLSAINTGSGKTRGRLWYGIGRYLYVPLAVILCCVALFMKVAF